ncbi:hypothetical protein LTR28_011393, partial [Elasticomyces elasticus]
MSYSDFSVAGRKLNDSHFDAAAAALHSITDSTIHSHHRDPKDTLHQPANSEKSHSWLKKIIPHHMVEEYEADYHMGNYVIDRQTGEKTFEPMSIY